MWDVTNELALALRDIKNVDENLAWGRIARQRKVMEGTPL